MTWTKLIILTLSLHVIFVDVAGFSFNYCYCRVSSLSVLRHSSEWIKSFRRDNTVSTLVFTRVYIFSLLLLSRLQPYSKVSPLLSLLTCSPFWSLPKIDNSTVWLYYLLLNFKGFVGPLRIQNKDSQYFNLIMNA